MKRLIIVPPAAFKMYREKGLSFKKLAPIFGISHATIRKQFIAAGFTPGPACRPRKFDWEWIAELKEGGLVCKEIAQLLEIKYMSVYAVLKRLEALT